MSFLFDSLRNPEKDLVMTEISRVLIETNVRAYRIYLLLKDQPKKQLANSLIFLLRECNSYLEKLLLVINLENSTAVIKDLEELNNPLKKDNKLSDISNLIDLYRSYEKKFYVLNSFLNSRYNLSKHQLSLIEKIVLNRENFLKKTDPEKKNHLITGKQNQPHPGDILRKFGDEYDHYGVYSGENKVIHFVESTSYRVPGRFLEVTETNLDYFAIPKQYEVINRLNYPLQRTLERAKSQLKSASYDIIFNNCEHFAFSCIEKNYSPTFNRLLETAKNKKSTGINEIFKKSENIIKGGLNGFFH